MSANDFRAELVKIMPGYDWTVHKSKVAGYLEATGTQTSGFNRLSTLAVIRIERDGEKPTYEVMSAGFGLKAKWLARRTDGTLARALRSLQTHYEATAATYRSHAEGLKQGRQQKAAEPSTDASEGNNHGSH